MLNTQDGQTQGQGSFAKLSNDHIRLLIVMAVIMAKTNLPCHIQRSFVRKSHSWTGEKERVVSQRREDKWRVLEAGGDITLKCHTANGEAPGGVGLPLGAQPITERFTWHSEEFPA